MRLLRACVIAVCAAGCLAAQQDGHSAAFVKPSEASSAASALITANQGPALEHVQDDNASVRYHWAFLLAGSSGWGAAPCLLAQP